MKLFLWDDVDRVTSNHHDSAGIVIIAGSLLEAQDLWTARKVELAELAKEDWAVQYVAGIHYELELERLPEPDRTYEVDPYSKEEVFIFPNAGCC